MIYDFLILVMDRNFKNLILFFLIATYLTAFPTAVHSCTLPHLCNISDNVSNDFCWLEFKLDKILDLCCQLLVEESTLFKPL